jgi:hypothetical protein
MNHNLSSIVAAVVIMIGAPAFGEDLLPDFKETMFRGPSGESGPAQAKVLGWTKNANLGANLSFSSSQDVVGETDGSSQTYGLNLKGGLIRMSEQDEWRNTLSLLENTTKTPGTPQFLKAADELKMTTIYLYNWPSRPDMGPYVRGELAAPIFIGQDIHATSQTYQAVHRDQSTSYFNGTSARLTDGFKPMTTKESVGAFWKAVQKENLKVEARLGFGALQINADGQYASKGPNAAGNIELDELSNVSQVGLEAAIGIKGKVDERSTYESGVEILSPFINNKAANDSRDAIALTNVDGFLKFNTNITSWAAFSYDYKLKIEPQLVNRAQQLHMLVLNVNYNVF